MDITVGPLKNGIGKRTIIVELDFINKTTLVKGDILDKETAIHMLSDAIHLVLSARTQPVTQNGNGGGHA